MRILDRVTHREASSGVRFLSIVSGHGGFRHSFPVLRLVKITLNTPAPLADLLDYLREHGCIAYLDEEGRCVHAVPADESELTKLLDAWAAEMGVTYALRD